MEKTKCQPYISGGELAPGKATGMPYGTLPCQLPPFFEGLAPGSGNHRAGAIEGTYGMENDVLLLDPHMSDYSGDGFRIVKLTKNGMEWQRLGATFQKDTVRSDFKLFRRKWNSNKRSPGVM